MIRLLKSRDCLMKCLGFVLLFGFISLGAIGGCNNNNGGGDPGPGVMTTLEIFNEGQMTTVFVNFGADSCIKVEDWSMIDCKKGEANVDVPCVKIPPSDLRCKFTIDKGSKCTIPLENCGQSNFFFGIGGAPNCGTTPFNGPTGFEVNVYGVTGDVADISVVSGFTVPISAMMNDGTILGPVTSGGLTDNANNFGVFPVGCTTCIARPGCPCPGPGLDCTSNVGCHPTENGQPNPVCQVTQPSGGTITLNILEN